MRICYVATNHRVTAGNPMRYSLLGLRSPVGRIRRAGLLALTLVVFTVAAPVQARRLALVIGNDGYQNVQPLKNARADAKAIAAELKEVGFDVSLSDPNNITSTAISHLGNVGGIQRRYPDGSTSDVAGTAGQWHFDGQLVRQVPDRPIPVDGGRRKVNSSFL